MSTFLEPRGLEEEYTLDCMVVITEPLPPQGVETVVAEAGNVKFNVPRVVSVEIRCTLIRVVYVDTKLSLCSTLHKQVGSQCICAAPHKIMLDGVTYHHSGVLVRASCPRTCTGLLGVRRECEQ